MGKLDDRTALITGGASGIGEAIARKFASEMANVSIVDIDFDSAKKLADEIVMEGGTAAAILCDVTNEEQVKEAVKKTAAEFGGIEILVNNAGVSPLRSLGEITLDEWNRVMAINLTGPFLFIQACFKFIKEAGTKGRVINIGSLAGQVGGIAVGLHYTASKGGLMAATKQAAKLLAPYRATANNIAPGTADTPLVQAWPEETRESLIKKIPLGRLTSTQDVANAALFLASDEAGFITGATLDVNGGMLIR